MPANLPPDYFEAEKRYRSAKTPGDKIQALKEMLAIMPKHKGTDKLQADLKRRIAKHKEEAETRKTKGGHRRSGLDSIDREGAAQVLLVGPPNTGKSSLIESVTNATPEVGDYPFTTRKPLPAMMPFEDIQIQLVDLPPITTDYFEHWAVSLLRNSDAVCVVVDVKSEPLVEVESIVDILDGKKIDLVGKKPPEVDEWSPIAYKKTLVIANKVDLDSGWQRYEHLRKDLRGRFDVIPFSCYNDELIPAFSRKLFEFLELIRVYTKVPGKKPDLGRPYVLARGSTVLDLAGEVHRDFLGKLKFAKVWGSGKFEGQNVQKGYVIKDKDIVELHI
ncbi:MAG: GTPase [Candidatus Glassbacteria bacterium]